MIGDSKVYQALQELNIKFEYYEHPPSPTIEIAMEHWKDIDYSTHCKNLFFRNHKGNRHYLVLLHYSQNLAVRDLEQRLKQGKISFASEKRMDKYLGLKAGSVSPFGLVNDAEKHVHLFIDQTLKQSKNLSFHPNDNQATLVISFDDFMKYLQWCGNSYEFIELY
ncbi:MAG: prolyl-tRNA synthetase associated domain-containing protein [Bacteroidales bacterium]|nr:prolyl-tRNA synthetase associated domain-containing protein [Bacteroidales bacterium]MCF8454725.1 prolyl-tRNA synthetase associated domain-containing protein [Bacteroidales bacterium]